MIAENFVMNAVDFSLDLDELKTLFLDYMHILIYIFIIAGVAKIYKGRG